MDQTVSKLRNLDFVMKKDHVVVLLVMKGEKNLNDLTLKRLIDRGYEQDSLPNRVLHLLTDEANYSKNSTIADCVNVDGRLHY